ncbi:MAG TPA: sulfotransferase, partial [Acidobacteriota bacterium]|nr:sulfotransferase [Acidobacteriota bacterium]
MAHPDAPLLSRLEGIEINPVFVIGQHRSGTTILYKILAETNHFNITSVFHILNRHRLLYLHENGQEEAARGELRQKFEALGLKDREFDSIKISDQTPEEYAYALPHQGRKPRLNWENLDAFQTFCRKVQFTQNPRRPLLLKNPFDAANFLFIARAFPTARFVFIHRDPVHVVNSQMKAIRSLLVSKNEYVALVVRRYRRLWEGQRRIAWARWLLSDRWPFLFQQVANEVCSINRYFVKHAPDLPENRYVSLTYPELCRRPGAVVGQVLDFLEVPRPDMDFDEQI